MGRIQLLGLCPSRDINWDFGTTHGIHGIPGHQMGLCPSRYINWDSGTPHGISGHQLGLCPSRDINWDFGTFRSSAGTLPIPGHQLGLWDVTWVSGSSAGTLPIPGHRSDNRVLPTWNELSPRVSIISLTPITAHIYSLPYIIAFKRK